MSDNGWLTTQMKKFRITQKEIAALLGIDPSGVSRLVAGQRKLSSSEQSRIHNFVSGRQRAYVDGKIDGSETRHPGIAPLVAIVWRGGLRAEDLNRMAGLPEGRIAAALEGTAPLSADECAAVANAVQVPADWVAGEPEAAETEEIDRRLAAMREVRAPKPAARSASVRYSAIPVYAAPVQEAGGLKFHYDVAETRPAPHPLDSVEAAYGIFVGNGDYGSRFRPGDVIFVHPSKPVVQGKDVLAILPRSSRLVVGTAEVDTEGAVAIRRSHDVIHLAEHGARAVRIVGAWWD